MRRISRRDYYERYYVSAGGLISYGPDYLDQFRSAAGYIDRILTVQRRPNTRL
jgi:ABC-type uncharacterized transport system substrate-binding protein